MSVTSTTRATATRTPSGQGDGKFIFRVVNRHYEVPGSKLRSTLTQAIKKAR